MLVIASLGSLMAERLDWRGTITRAVAVMSPLLLTVATIALLAPEYGEGVRRFLTNADSGIPLLSAENAAWFLGLPVRQLFGNPTLAWGALGVAASSMAVAARNRPPLVLPASFVLIGLTTMFVHPMKVDRNLFVLIAPATLCIVLPMVRWADRPLRTAALSTLALVGLGGQVFLSRGYATEQYYSSSSSVNAALSATVKACGHARKLVLAGAQRDLSEQVILYALRTARCDAEVVVQVDFTPTCLTPVGPSLPECQMRSIREAFSRTDSAVIYVDATTGPGAKHRRWLVAQRSAFLSLASNAGFEPTVVELPDKGLRLAVWSR